MKTTNKILALEKSNFLAKLEQAKNIMLGEKGIKILLEHPATPLQYLINEGLESGGITTALNEIGVSLNKLGTLFVPLPNNGACSFPATNIFDIIANVKKEYPSNVPDKENIKQVKYNIVGKLQDYCNYSSCETPLEHLEQLDKAHWNCDQCINEIELLKTEPNPEEAIKLKARLNGANERLIIFNKLLEGAKKEYSYAQTNYVQTEINKLVYIEFGAHNSAEELNLKKQLIELHRSIEDMPIKVKWQTKQDKENLVVYKKKRGLIEKRQYELYKIKEIFEARYNTNEYRDKFNQEFLNCKNIAV